MCLDLTVEDHFDTWWQAVHSCWVWPTAVSKSTEGKHASHTVHSSPAQGKCQVSEVSASMEISKYLQHFSGRKKTQITVFCWTNTRGSRKTCFKVSPHPTPSFIVLASEIKRYCKHILEWAPCVLGQGRWLWRSLPVSVDCHHIVLVSAFTVLSRVWLSFLYYALSILKVHAYNYKWIKFIDKTMKFIYSISISLL